MRNSLQDNMQKVADGLSRHRKTFTALGDPNRQAILVALLNNYGGMRVGEIAKSIGLSRPATSHHLKTLAEAGLVGSYSKGTMNFYHAASSEAEWREISALAKKASEIAAAASLRDDNEVRSSERSR